MDSSNWQLGQKREIYYDKNLGLRVFVRREPAKVYPRYYTGHLRNTGRPPLLAKMTNLVCNWSHQFWCPV